MTLAAPACLDDALPDRPDLLQRLQAQSGGDEDLALLGALGLGGTPLALQLLADGHPDWTREAGVERLIQVFFAAAEAPDGGGSGHASTVAEQLTQRFALPGAPRSLFDLMRADLLIHVGPLDEVSEAVLAAMRHERWDLALAGMARVRSELQARTPGATYGLGAMCLHKLGRFDEADEWVQAGLGEQAERIRIPAVRTQAELLQRWGSFDAPVISILCTTYNHQRYIDSALQGFLSQDCSHPFEILIHDDASSDGTQAIIRRWQARYPAIIKPVLQTENQFSKGVRPFELLLARARGGFVATCEGDDFWIDAGKLQRQVDFLIRHPDVSCTAHNYLHFMESSLSIQPWTRLGRDFFLSPRQLKQIALVLWLPTLVFRKTFSTLPPERDLAAIGDAFLTSFLGTQGRCAYFETWHAAVRRENEFSLWSPLSQREKERRRVRTWAALARFYERLGEDEAVADLRARIAASSLDEPERQLILDAVSSSLQPALVAA